MLSQKHLGFSISHCIKYKGSQWEPFLLLYFVKGKVIPAKAGICGRGALFNIRADSLLQGNDLKPLSPRFYISTLLNISTHL